MLICAPPFLLAKPPARAAVAGKEDGGGLFQTRLPRQLDVLRAVLRRGGMDSRELLAIQGLASLLLSEGARASPPQDWGDGGRK